MTKNYKLKDGTVIREIQKGTFTIIFPNKRYMIITTWTGKVEVDIAGYGKFDMGIIQN